MTLVNQIVSLLRDQIENGKYRSQARLPSIRAGAVHFKVSKNTMADAYDRLVAEGLLYARQGSGYYVAETISVTELPKRVHIAQAIDTVSLLRQQLEPEFEVRVGDGRVPTAWSSKEVGRQLQRALAQGTDLGLGYGSPWGYAPLRERLRVVLQERGISAGMNQVLLTHGANHALDLVARYLLSPGDTVLVESPGYYPLFGKLRYLNITMVAITRTAHGPDLEMLEQKVLEHRPKLFFTQTLAHNPTGGSTSIAHQHKILSLAQHYDFYVVEDDAFADLVPAEWPRLATLDQLQRVVYVATFSKTLSAALRIGYVAANPALSQAMCDLKMLTLVATSDLVERAVLKFMNDGHYVRHLRRLRARLQEAKSTVIQRFEKLGWKVLYPNQSGFYLWVALPSHLSEEQLGEQASLAGVFIAPGSIFSIDKEQMPAAMRVNIAYAEDPRFWGFLQQLNGLC